MSQHSRLNIALILTLGSGAILVFLSQNRTIGEVIPLVLGVLIFIGVAQYIVLFRGERTTTHPELRTAQQEFMQGKFQAVIERLEQTTAFELPDNVLAAMLTLQGNAYRQLGQLDLSEGILQDAVQLQPDDHYPLYGLGRTLLVMGNYTEAQKYLSQALAQGAKKTTRAELALAQHYGNWPVSDVFEVARQAGKMMRLEPYRALMVNFMLYQFYGAENTPNTQQQQVARDIMRNTQQGLAFWQAEAERFSLTPYGRRLAKDVQKIRELIDI